MAEQTRAPTSDDAVSGTWTGSAGSRWQVVDDYPDTAGTDELTHGTTAGNLTFGFSAFSIPAGSTNIVVLVDYFDFKNGSQSCNFGGRLKVGASYFNATTHNPANGAASRTQRTDTWATNPATSAAWTVDQVNGTAGSNNLTGFGYVSTDASPTVTTSSIRLRVTYDPPPARVGTLSQSIGDVTLSAAGSVSVNGTASVPIGDVTLSAAGSVAVSGSLETSIGEVTLVATGTTVPLDPRVGTLTQSIGDVTLAATGSVLVNGALSASIGDVALTATGSVRVNGELSVSIGEITLSASGVSGAGGGEAAAPRHHSMSLGLGL